MDKDQQSKISQLDYSPTLVLNPERPLLGHLSPGFSPSICKMRKYVRKWQENLHIPSFFL